VGSVGFRRDPGGRGLTVIVGHPSASFGKCKSATSEVDLICIKARQSAEWQ
jgi:hypothetical protein